MATFPPYSWVRDNNVNVPMSSGYFVSRDVLCTGTLVVVSHRELSLTVLDVLELTVPQFRAHMRAAEGGPCPRHSSRVPGRDQRSFLPPVAPLQPPLRPHQAPV